MLKMFKGIDFYSDTLTKPSSAMRQAIANADVGDEQKGEDPTTLELEALGAELLGHTATMFFPTATMANQVAIQYHCDRGDELVAADTAHIYFAEAGGPAIHAGVMCKPIITKTGIFDGDALKLAYRNSKGPHYPVTKLVAIENTANLAGGFAWPAKNLDSVNTTAKSLSMKTHVDGSRLFNAAAAIGTSVRNVASPFDTVTICLSKGLGCPAGALLAYPKEAFPRIRRLKQLMGGALRQSGILAAAGLYALRNNVSRLLEDHENAALLSRGLTGLKSIEVETPSADVTSTNMVFFRWTHPTVSADDFDTRLRERGVRFSIESPGRFRAVTHLDISKADVENTVRIVRSLVNEV